jgi:hypothetical protein
MSGAHLSLLGLHCNKKAAPLTLRAALLTHHKTHIYLLHPYYTTFGAGAPQARDTTKAALQDEPPSAERTWHSWWCRTLPCSPPWSSLSPSPAGCSLTRQPHSVAPTRSPVAAEDRLRRSYLPAVCRRCYTPHGGRRVLDYRTGATRTLFAYVLLARGWATPLLGHTPGRWLSR